MIQFGVLTAKKIVARAHAKSRTANLSDIHSAFSLSAINNPFTLFILFYNQYLFNIINRFIRIFLDFFQRIYINENWCSLCLKQPKIKQNI